MMSASAWGELNDKIDEQIALLDALCGDGYDDPEHSVESYIDEAHVALASMRDNHRQGDQRRACQDAVLVVARVSAIHDRGSVEAQPDPDDWRELNHWLEACRRWSPVSELNMHVMLTVERANRTGVSVQVADAVVGAAEVLADTVTDEYDASRSAAETVRTLRRALHRLSLAVRQARQAGDHRTAELLARITRSLSLRVAEELQAQQRAATTVPTPKALAPPGRAIVAQPIAANAPPAGWAGIAA